MIVIEESFVNYFFCVSIAFSCVIAAVMCHVLLLVSPLVLLLHSMITIINIVIVICIYHQTVTIAIIIIIITISIQLPMNCEIHHTDHNIINTPYCRFFRNVISATIGTLYYCGMHSMIQIVLMCLVQCYLPLLCIM